MAALRRCNDCGSPDSTSSFRMIRFSGNRKSSVWRQKFTECLLSWYKQAPHKVSSWDFCALPRFPMYAVSQTTNDARRSLVSLCCKWVWKMAGSPCSTAEWEELSKREPCYRLRGCEYVTHHSDIKALMILRKPVDTEQPLASWLCCKQTNPRGTADIDMIFWGRRSPENLWFLAPDCRYFCAESTPSRLRYVEWAGRGSGTWRSADGQPNESRCQARQK